MATVVTVLLVQAEGSVRVASVEPVQDSWLGLVDDVNTDTVFAWDRDVLVKVSANGQGLGKPVNRGATAVLEWLVPGFGKSGRVFGDAVFVGMDTGGDFADVPGEVLAFVERLRGVTLT